MQQGIVTRAIGGFFRVLLEDGRVIESRPRGRLRQVGVMLLVGDRVDVSVQPDGGGVIEAVQPRKTQLLRPPVANVKQVVIVTALTDPAPNYVLLDRMLVSASAAGISPLLCFNKADLVSEDVIDDSVHPYQAAGYDVIVTSAATERGLESLRRALAGKVSTFAGPSGVGKSALLNSLHPSWDRATGAVSRRLGRGRHTTRAVELLSLPEGGLVADTPGFSTLDVRDIPPAKLGRHWPEIDKLAAGCRFPGCLHRQEPECAVRRAAEGNDVHPRRYQHYVDLLNEIEQWEARRYS